VEQAEWARNLARRLLAESLPIRWAHTEGVGRRAESIAHLVGAEAGVLVSAAWLHDIGYSRELAATGFHPLDGARYLRDTVRADDAMCRLVAHHSFAMIEARNRGLDDELLGEFPRFGGLVADALTYCDMTTSPHGKPVTVEVRLSEILGRYANGSVVAESIQEARSQILRSVRMVAAALAEQPS
jgi:hypothetical protein